MRRKEKQVSDISVLHNVIYNAKICRIGLVNDNLPYVIPMSFGFDGTYIYFHSAISGEKVEILKKNNHVCIEFEHNISIIEHEKPCNWGADYLTVVVHGTAEIMVDPAKKSYGLNQIISHYKVGTQEYLFSDEELKTVLVYKITSKEIIGKISGMEI